MRHFGASAPCLRRNPGPSRRGRRPERPAGCVGALSLPKSLANFLARTALPGFDDDDTHEVTRILEDPEYAELVAARHRALMFAGNLTRSLSTREVVRVGLLGRVGVGRVRICCKGAPDRDRPRMKARNINDSPPAPRPDRGLCNRFGQPTLRWIERAPRTPAPMGRMGLVGRPGRSGEARNRGPPPPAPDDRARPPSAAGCGRARAWPRRAPTAR